MVKCIWSIKNPCDILNELKSKDTLAFSLPAYDYSTFYITLSHNIIKENLAK